ncbi:MAG TPA: Rne/Rng family ribonuclease [Acidimicrobiales bacterium]|nr:Rne/Rng family ribonuclease [Acidimicrobiales bacterium]
MSETDVSGSPETPQGAAEAAGATPPPAQPPSPAAADDSATDAGGAPAGTAGGDGTPRKRRRRGSRGGRKRSKPRAEGAESGDGGHDGHDDAGDDAAAPTGERANGRAPAGGGSAAKATEAAGKAGDGQARGAGANRARGRGRTRGAGAAGDKPGGDDERNPELPDRHREGRPSAEAGAKATVAKAPKPKIGDTIPADVLRQMEGRKPDEGEGGQGGDDGEGRKRRRRRGGRGRSGGNKGGDQSGGENRGGNGGGDKAGGGQRSGGRRRGAHKPVEAVIAHSPTELDEETLERRRGRERKGRAVGRYSMCVHVSDKATQIAVLEGRSLIEHYVSHPSDDVSQIHGNVYIGRVQNVLPGMEAAFVDIGTPKNAVLYRGDVHYDPEDVERSSSGGRPRIEEVLRAGQTILCQVTKNPIGAKGARLTQEVSLPGRFVVLIPNSSTYGISKRLPDEERKRLRTILDRVKPAQHGVIVRTAAENVTTEEIEDDVRRLLDQWNQIDALAKRSKAPALLYREPDMAVRVIREEFSQDYRSVLIDDRALYNAVRDYVASISPELADRVEFYDPEAEPLPLYERHHVHEQLHRALDRKVWLPSGGSLIIEHTEALTVIDVNTGKNVGRSSLEETVFKNNLEAAVEIARQLRLRDVGGIIVVDFIDMERKDNRDEVVRVFRDALSRDKTRTQVFEISELGICEMTRKRIGEGLLESFTSRCPECEGRGVLIDRELLPD